MSPGKKDYSHHNYPLERIEKAISFLKENDNKKIGIIGASTTGTLALASASYFSDISLTIAFTPSDFIWQGFAQGNKDGCKEWPIDGESLFTYHNIPLPYMPFCYQHPEYWKIFKEECKSTGNVAASRRIFDDSELAHPIKEEEFIKIENINGKLVLIGAMDDSLWNTAKYIRRMENRLKNKPHKCQEEIFVYEYGTHYVFPQSLIKNIFPLCSTLLLKLMFKSAKENSKECKNTRIDIEYRLLNILKDWKNA